MKICEVCDREMFTLSNKRKRHPTCRKQLSDEQKTAAKLRAFERENRLDIAAGRSISNTIGVSSRSVRRRREVMQRAA